MQLYIGSCHVVLAEIAVTTVEKPADYEVRSVIRFLQADEILGYLPEETSCRVEFFCCTEMYDRILPGRQKYCYVTNSIGTSSSTLRIVRTWYRRTFSVSKNEGPPCW